ncbi:MAG: Ig-like domain-containing protein [Proteobacteria bacterium]|nr:Ig-like domain-containing protein [Pseudomonadota bacterium]MBU1715109.1 Ig-like domain-containing protein [Pseudomonadota bacterium]
MKVKVIVVVILALLFFGCNGGSKYDDVITDDNDTTTDPVPSLEVVSYYPDSDVQPVYADDIQTTGIYVIFNEAVDGATLTSLTATLIDDEPAGGQPVNGTISYIEEERKGKFVPDAPLFASYYYTATISGEIIDADGNTQNKEFSWQFQIALVSPPPPL